jgi:hypothetical protein
MNWGAGAAGQAREAHIEPPDWMAWLRGDMSEVTDLLVPPSPEFRDLADAVAMDALLSQSADHHTEACSVQSNRASQAFV